MSNKSRRRVTLAAGAILAGAAIPIAATGTAWAQGGDDLPNYQTLVSQGVPPAEAAAAEAAAAAHTPVSVSDTAGTFNDGYTGVDGAANSSSVLGVKSDSAVAIGTGSDAVAGANSTTTNDNAYASGTNAYADAGGSNSYFGTAGGSHDTAYDIGNNPNDSGQYGAGAWGSNDNLSVYGSSDSIAVTGSHDNVGVAGGTPTSGDYVLDPKSYDVVGVTGNDIGSSSVPVDISHGGTAFMPYFDSVTPFGQVGF